jgi:hypothetical protein
MLKYNIMKGWRVWEWRGEENILNWGEEGNGETEKFQNETI